MRKIKLNSAECLPSNSVQSRSMRNSERAGEPFQHPWDAYGRQRAPLCLLCSQVIPAPPLPVQEVRNNKCANQ